MRFAFHESQFEGVTQLYSRSAIEISEKQYAAGKKKFCQKNNRSRSVSSEGSTSTISPKEQLRAEMQSLAYVDLLD